MVVFNLLEIAWPKIELHGDAKNTASRELDRYDQQKENLSWDLLRSLSDSAGNLKGFLEDL